MTDTLPASFASDASVLLASLSNDFDRLMDQIIGSMERTLAHVDLPRPIFQVTRALMQHAGFHSNRIWCCQLSIVEILERVKVKRRSPSTIKRCLAILEEHGFIRTISDPGELMAGPGPHRRPEELRESQYRTATRDIGGLMKLLQSVLIDARTPLPVPGLDDPQKLPDPFSEPSPDSLSKTTLPAPPGALTPPRGGAPPQSRQAEITSKVELNTDSKQTQKGQTAPKGRIFQRSKMNHISGTDENEASGGQTHTASSGGARGGSEVGSQEAQPSRANASSAPLGRETLPANGLTPEQEAMAERLVKETRGGLGKGIDLFPARAYVRRFGIEWCTSLLIYGRECEIRDGDRKGGGWYTNTIKNWKKGDGEWPTWMRRRLKIEEATAELATRAAEISREATPVVSRAEAEAAAGGDGLDATEADLEALPAAEREALLDRALADVLAGFARVSPTRVMIAKRGRAHSMVVARAVKMLGEEKRRGEQPDG